MDLIAVLVVFLFAREPSLLEWGKGPMQWLMTREEQRAWRGVKTEAQARDYVDLFWARRDPTPGTPENELRGEMESRVRYADQNFSEERRRGALTERGRVLIVLGYPKNLGREEVKRTAQYSMNSGSGGPDAADPTGGRAMAAREEWEYERETALKYRMPKIQVVFIYDGTGRAARRDPQRTDFTSALPNAISYYMKSPDLTTVPEWARSGLRYVSATSRETAVTAVQSSPAPPAAAAQAAAPPPSVPARPAGAGRLTLVRDAFAIDAQSGTDPFASLTSASRFRKDADLGWAAEYCIGEAAADLETVSVTVRISGMVNGQRVNFNAPPDDLSPDSIKGSPGCYLVRGAIPLAEIDPGLYTLTILLAGRAGRQSYNLTREFQVE